MWSKRCSATEGFTLSELLLALGTAMLCSALQGNIRGLAVALNAIAEKEGGPEAPAEAAEAPAAE